MDINIIGVPLKYGSDIEGVQYGPDKLREAGMIEVFEKQNHQVYDLGNIFVAEIPKEDKNKEHKNMNYLYPIADINKNLAQVVYMSIKNNTFPLTIGGDHSLGMGSIAGASKFYKKMAVIWVDAHGDINDYNTSPTGNIHGMPLAASFGLGDSKLTDIYYKGSKVNPLDVYIVGARDLDPGEVEIAKNSNLNLYSMDMIRDQGLDKVLNDLIKRIERSQVDGVHLSFDIDALDKKLVPGTGTPVEDGFKVEEGKFILEKILQSKLITSMDFVEYNPVLDNEDRETEKICLEYLKTISKNL